MLLLVQRHPEIYTATPPAWPPRTRYHHTAIISKMMIYFCNENVKLFIAHVGTLSAPKMNYKLSVCVCVCVCPGGAVQPSSPAVRLCPVGITCHGAESLIDASCFSGGNYSAQMSRPNLWLRNVDTWAWGRGDTAAPEGLTRWFGQQMWGADGGLQQPRFTWVKVAIQPCINA